MNTKLGFATLALGTFLTLLAPAAAVARDRDDFRQNDNRGYTNSFRDNRYDRETRRERELRLRLERERFERFQREQQRRNHDRGYNDWNRY